MMKIKLSIKGFGLIEVMVALVILAVGILGISKLQGTLIRNSSDANQRAVALSIAQQKIDDLKSFAKLTVGTATDTVPDTWVPGISPNLLAFAHISNNKGGTIGQADATTPFPLTVGGISYLLSWNVANYYYTGAPLLPTTPVPAGTDIDFKQVAINVTWTAENGTSQNIVLNTVIDSYAPSLTALANNSSTGGIPPRAGYTPELAPDVIDISVDTGNGTKRQTSKPLPDAVKTGADSNTLVTFDVISYFQDGADFFEKRQEEFQTVDCTCKLSASAGLGYPPGHVVWDESVNDRYDTVGNLISKATATQTGNANAVDDTCTVCCRDHHDNTASAVKYVAGTTSGDHVHYKATGAVATANTDYVESCRFKRIDGVMRVFQDWNLLAMTVVNRNDIADGQPLQTQYTAYVEQLVKDKVEGTTAAVKPPLRTPITTTMGTKQQLESRGVYIDQVYDTVGSPSNAYATYVTNSGNLNRLERIPFTEVNLTLLSVWSSSIPANASITNEPVATVADPVTNYYGTYSRGWMDAKAVATPATNITATIRNNNDGITQITSRPTATYTNVSDVVEININGPVAVIPRTISGTYAITFPLGSTSAPSITITGGGTCILPGSPGNTYQCSVTSTWVGTVQINVAVTTGSPTKRCTGASAVYSGSASAGNLTHNFASFSCN